jgi:hypothetical protein
MCAWGQAWDFLENKRFFEKKLLAITYFFFFIKIDKNIFQEGFFKNENKIVAFHHDTIFLEIYFKFSPKDHLNILLYPY